MGITRTKKKQAIATAEQQAIVAVMAQFAGWIERVDNTPREPFDPDDGWMPPKACAAFSMVGAYSEAFFGCSYNEDSVLDLLLSGDMDKPESRLMGESWFKDQMGADFRKDGKYAEQLMAAVEAAGGWPKGYNQLVPLGEYVPKVIAWAVASQNLNS